jgi:hypothetical protein
LSYSECVKSRAYIDVVEKLETKSEKLLYSLKLAKFTIALAEQNMNFAESCLKDMIIDKESEYNPVLSCVKKWIDSLSSTTSETNFINAAKITEVFKLLAGKYPK